MGLRPLVATDGMMLTNGQTCGKTIYLGINDSPDNWYEITEEEYNNILSSFEEELIEE
jgi:hypothetical protein